MTRQQIVAETLRFLSDGWVDSLGGERWLAETADEIEKWSPGETMCCPLCAEVDCDDNCPLRFERAMQKAVDISEELGLPE